MTKARSIGSAVLILAAVSAPAGAASYLINASPANTIFSGAWTYTGSDNFLRDDFAYTQDAAAMLTSSPSAAGVGFVPGNYDLYVQWDVYAGSPPATAGATYTVNHTGGPTAVTINQQQYANQSTPNGAPFADIQGSGLYYVGNFNLDNASTITLTKAAGEPTTYLTHDAVYLTNDGVVIEDMSAKVTYTGYSGNNIYYYPGQPAIDITSSYPYTTTLGGTATYEPGLTGLREVFISWSAASHHSTSVGVLFDADGNLGTTGDQVVLPSINNTQLADGTPTVNTTQLWSQLESLGQFNLQANSVFVFTNNTASAMPMDVMWVSNVIPEPASAAVIAAGGLLVLGRRRRIA
jgi:hypothetical protein